MKCPDVVVKQLAVGLRDDEYMVGDKFRFIMLLFAPHNDERPRGWTDMQWMI